MNLVKSIFGSLLVLILSTMAFFVIAAGISLSKLELGKIKIDDKVDASAFLLRLVGSESAMLGQGLDEEFSFSKMGFELLTNVQIDDIRSLVRYELPGFVHFDLDILIAGEGTDYTDIPIESAPPVEELLKEREMASKELAELQDGHDVPPGNVPTEKNIFIYHTHSWESYLPLLGIEGAKDEDQSVDGKTNITIVGDLLGKELESKGIGVTVDKTNVGQELNKRNWKTAKSYEFSRTLVQQAMASNGKLNYFIDLHRDSLRKDSTSIEINQKPYAKLVFVIGKDNKNYDKNIAFANGMHEYLQAHYPGLSKGVLGKSGAHVDGVYNQDLSPNSVVVEVGGVDNDMKELKNSVGALAEAISHLYWKAEAVQGSN